MKIPDEIFELIREGIWPHNHEAELHQNLKSIIPPEKVKIFAPEEERLYLYAPPFHTAYDEANNGQDCFWSHAMSAAHEIDLMKSLIIGDFGLGSDTAIILDYRSDINQPRVLRLKWSTEGNHWVECAQTFSEFATLLRNAKEEDKQANHEQPATRHESTPQGGEKPQPEPKPVSR